jgi:hypothetical protein
MAEQWLAEAQNLAKALKSIPWTDVHPFMDPDMALESAQKWFKVITMHLIFLRVRVARRASSQSVGLVEWTTNTDGVPVIKEIK